MAKLKDEINKKDEKKVNPKSPFKDIALFETEIKDFINKFKAKVVTHSKRVSDYFEMSCFNDIVRFYEFNNYTITVENLQKNEYKYKCSTSGIQTNFSHFQASINYNDEVFAYEIHHNLAVQSCHDSEIFTTPDISIIKAKTAQTILGYYETNTRFSFVENKNLMSFCECKQFPPFPELLFNFIGVINELRLDIIFNKFEELVPIHIAPSLMVSGKPNRQTSRIKNSLENRFCVNIIYDLFYSRSITFSKNNIKNLRTAGKLSIT